eukprot:6209916-Pleurochrysis_carterae.AAC.1
MAAASPRSGVGVSNEGVCSKRLQRGRNGNGLGSGVRDSQRTAKALTETGCSGDRCSAGCATVLRALADFCQKSCYTSASLIDATPAGSGPAGR